VDRAIQFGKVCALLALTLLLASLLMLVLELRASEMRLAAKADAVLDQASIAAGTATRYSVTQERALRGNEAQLSKLLVATNNSLNGCPKCPPAVLPTLQRVIARADSNLNGDTGALPALAKLARNTDDSLNSDKYGLIPITTLSIARVSSGAVELEGAAMPLILHADDLVDSVALKSSLSHIDSTTAHLDKSMEHIEFKVNQFVHPSKKQKAWDRFKDGLGVGLTVLRHIVF
jgi:hypothetical protein